MTLVRIIIIQQMKYVGNDHHDNYDDDDDADDADDADMGEEDLVIRANILFHATHVRLHSMQLRINLTMMIVMMKLMMMKWVIKLMMIFIITWLFSL